MYLISKEKYYQKLKEKFPEDDFTILEPFTGAKNPVTIKCNQCGQNFNYNRGTTLYTNRRKHLCPLCNSNSVKEMRKACNLNNISIIKCGNSVTDYWFLQCNKCNTTFSRQPSAWLQKIALTVVQIIEHLLLNKDSKRSMKSLEKMNL